MWLCADTPTPTVESTTALLFPCRAASGELWPHSCPPWSVPHTPSKWPQHTSLFCSKGLPPFTNDPCLTPPPNLVLSTTLSESLCPHTCQGLSNLKSLHLELLSPALPEETDTFSPFRTKMCVLEGPSRGQSPSYVSKMPRAKVLILSNCWTREKGTHTHTGRHSPWTPTL